MKFHSKFLTLFLGLMLMSFPLFGEDNLKVGDKAPNFDAPSTLGHNLKLSDFKGQWLALYFYPKAFTPGCTKESCNLRDGFSELKKLNVTVLGVSLDKIETQNEFKEKYKLPFELLADDQKQIAKAYDVLAAFSLFTKRHTFLINPDGVIVHIFTDVKSGQHDTQILTKMKELQSQK